MTSQSTLIRIGSNTRPNAAAGSIAKTLRKHPIAEVQAIGSGAINQAIKAITVARAYLQEEDIDLTLTPSFVDIIIEGKERTAIHLTIYRQEAINHCHPIKNPTVSLPPAALSTHPSLA